MREHWRWNHLGERVGRGEGDRWGQRDGEGGVQAVVINVNELMVGGNEYRNTGVRQDLDLHTET